MYSRAVSGAPQLQGRGEGGLLEAFGNRFGQYIGPQLCEQVGTRMHGDAWGCMGMHGNAWGCMGMHGNAWECMGMHGDAWGCMGWTTERYFLLPDRSLRHRQVVDIQAVHFRPHVGLQAGGNRGGSGGDRAGPPAPALRGALLESGQRRSVVVVGVIHGVVAGPGAGGYGLDGEEGNMKAAR